MSQKDYQIDETKLQFGVAASSKNDIGGMAASVVIEEYRAHIHEFWKKCLIQSAQNLPKPKPFYATQCSKQTSQHDVLDIMRGAINITTVRNKIGMGGLLDLAQKSVQIIRNNRTSKHAFVLGPEVLEQLFDEQVITLLEEMHELQGVLVEESAAEQARVTRADFVQMTTRFTPIKVDIPAVPGHAPSTEIQI
jgi:hypothetical protein